MELIAIHPRPSPTPPPSLIGMPQGLGCGCILLNEAAVQERMPGKIYGDFIWPTIRVRRLRLGKSKRWLAKKEYAAIFSQ